MITGKMKVTAVVPVYNEEKTIGNVLKVLTSSNQIGNILVVDDGSIDNTPKVLKKIKSKKLKIIKLKKNSGKGSAVRVATKKLKSDIILFIDSDLIGLKEEHIKKLLDPVINKNAAMVIGLRDKGNAFANMLMPYFPLTGGERAILAKVFMAIRKSPLIEGWGLESVMNDYCKKKKLNIAKVKLDGMDHIGLQTKKYGLMAFLKEIYDVILIKIKLFGVKYD
ncbi:glycosyltransferase family 2 protein [Candidatus Woesearchaeota archaeon]|nr:glycosyltransferase family 2 protein [Candidatus Woesearchaeota archaeon]